MKTKLPLKLERELVDAAIASSKRRGWVSIA
jgi:hypothetical protein